MKKKNEEEEEEEEEAPLTTIQDSPSQPPL